MNRIFKKIFNIVGWILLFAAFASMGFSSNDPSVGIPVFLVFFLVVFGLVYLYVKKHKKHTVANPKVKNIVHKILSVVLMLLAIATPLVIFKNANFSTMIYVIIALVTVVLIAIGMLAVNLINKSKTKGFIGSLIGYIVLIIISAVPALSMMQYDSSYNALGMVYYAAIITAIFAWWSFSLFSSEVS